MGLAIHTEPPFGRAHSETLAVLPGRAAAGAEQVAVGAEWEAVDAGRAAATFVGAEWALPGRPMIEAQDTDPRRFETHPAGQ